PGSAGLELDFAERRLVLFDVLLQHVKQGFGLLGTNVNALEVRDGNSVRGSLIDAPEQQQEVPQVHPDLNAIRVILTVLRSVRQLDLGRRRLAHRLQSSTGIAAYPLSGSAFRPCRSGDSKIPEGGVFGNGMQPLLCSLSGLRFFTNLVQPLQMVLRRMK